MKKLIIGCTLMLSAVILYSSIHLSAVIYMPSINGWGTPPGRFGTALIETEGIVPTYISMIMGTMGSLIIAYEFYKEAINKRQK